MSASRRVVDEPAYILHSHPWSESSLVLHLWCRHEGRVTVLAKGAKRPYSQFRPVLLPLQRTRVSYRINDKADQPLGTLQAAQWGGGQPMPPARRLLAGFYCNELLQRLLALGDAHPLLYDLYDSTIQALAQASHIPALLRAFELMALREVGLLPSLNTTAEKAGPLLPDRLYTLQAQKGLEPVAQESVAQALYGHAWLDMHEAMTAWPTGYTGNHDKTQCHLHLRDVLSKYPNKALQIQLRDVLVHACGPTPLSTRAMMHGLKHL